MFLWAMVNPAARLDTGSRLVRHMVKVGQASSSKIVIGGLITRIAV